MEFSEPRLHCPGLPLVNSLSYGLPHEACDSTPGLMAMAVRRCESIITFDQVSHDEIPRLRKRNAIPSKSVDMKNKALTVKNSGRLTVCTKTGTNPRIPVLAVCSVLAQNTWRRFLYNGADARSLSAPPPSTNQRKVVPPWPRLSDTVSRAGSSACARKRERERGKGGGGRVGELERV